MSIELNKITFKHKALYYGILHIICKIYRIVLKLHFYNKKI